MSRRAILFDLDGTLVDSSGDLATAVNRVRAEHDLPDLLREDWRPAARERLADDHVHAFNLVLAVDARVKGEQAELRDVDHDGRRVEMGQPAPALERQFDLPHARRQRLGEFREGPFADDPVHRQAVAPLELLDGADQLRVDDRIGRRLVNRQVPERDQQQPQFCGPSIGSTGLQGAAFEWRKPVQTGI